MEDVLKLISLLNYYTKEYDNGTPKISDQEWDFLYQNLEIWEKETGIVYPNSPTHSIQYESVDKLKKVKHNHPMLSLNKIYNNIDELNNFLSRSPCIIMLKMDGLTCSLRYVDGKLVGAETRGNGEEGEDILHNARLVKNIPLTIDRKDELIVDGEIICTYKDFEPFKDKYANPRNFAAGSIRLLDNKESQARNLTFVAWDCITPVENTLYSKLLYLNRIGFTTVPVLFYTSEMITESLIELSIKEAEYFSYPIDGIVIKYNNCEYYDSLGSTAHHPLGGVAYKFYNEAYPTKLKNIEWTMGRTGVLTPVAIVEPVEIDGAIIERANLHNINIMNELFGEQGPKANQTVYIYRANEIIPQIREVDQDTGNEVLKIPEFCPYCGQPTAQDSSGSTIELICTNDSCQAKLINVLDHFCGKKGLDIKGLSKATLDKLITWSWVGSIQDLFGLDAKRKEWIEQPGFGVKSVDNILKAIDGARGCELHQFISALGIPFVGTTYAKQFAKIYKDWHDFRSDVEQGYDFTELDGIGKEINFSIHNYDYKMADEIELKYLHIKNTLINETSNENGLADVNVAITGKLQKFKNRAELEDEITKRGGKISKSITGKTTLLINNDNTSSSTKNREAKAKGIPIITEEEFITQYLSQLC